MKTFSQELLFEQDKNGKEAREETEGEGKRSKGNIREGSREGKTGTVLELSLPH